MLSAFMLSLMWFIIFVTPIVLFHELGHFIFARIFGVEVKVFSIGFGKPIVSWKDSKGTSWRLSMIPIGGYVKMCGGEDIAGSSFEGQAPWKKSLVVFAGPFANYILALILFITVAFFEESKQISNEVSRVESNSPAQICGIKSGDLLVDTNGKIILSPLELSKIINLSKQEKIILGIIRDHKYMQLLLIPTNNTIPHVEVMTNKNIGVTFKTYKHNKLPVSEILVNSFKEVNKNLALLFKSVIRMLTARSGIESIGGPIKVARISKHTAATQDLCNIVRLIALLSLNLGIVNLLPIPPLDGGHLLFYITEAIIKKPISIQTLLISSKIGHVLLIITMLLAFWNDMKGIEFFNKIKLLLA